MAGASPTSDRSSTGRPTSTSRTREWALLTAAVVALSTACERPAAERHEPRATSSALREATAAATNSEAPQTTIVRSTARAQDPPVSTALLAAQELTWHFPATTLGPSLVVVSVPRQRRTDQRFPVLIALHGRGEAAKPAQRGARGWLDDYAMTRAIARLGEPPLNAEDFGGMVSAERLARLNQSLERRPYRGLIIVCPYLPDRFKGEQAFEEVGTWSRFLSNQVLPRVRAETPAVASRRATALDGVSLGGRVALMAGALARDAFGALGALQPALDVTELERVASALERARQHDGDLLLRLVTSDQDYFLRETRQLSKILDRRGVAHHIDVLRGDHSYAFNRGPGVYEMLLFYDRVLRSEAYL